MIKMSRFALVLVYYAAIWVAFVEPQTPSPTFSSRQLTFPLLNGINKQAQQTANTINMVKTIGDTISAVSGGGAGLTGSGNENSSSRALEDLLNSFMPHEKTTAEPSTKETITTTPGPIESLGKNIDQFGTAFAGGAKLFEAPLRVLSGILSGTTNITRAGADGIDQATDGVVKATETTSKVVSTLANPTNRRDRGRKPKKNHDDHNDEHSEDKDEDEEYYEYSGAMDPYSLRRPKYFSRECPFRFACEVGKIMKPLAHPFTKQVEKSRFFQDLQNRYTRAMTYGSLKGDCDRYYCVLVALFGGPQGFASGVAEIINRMVNPDTYEAYDLVR